MAASPVQTSFFRTTAYVVGVNLFSKVLGILREAMIAANFGARESTDAFFAAWRLPDILFNSLLGVLIANTFIPVFYSAQQSGGEAASRRFTGAALSAVLLILLAVAGVFECFAPQILSAIAPGLGGQSAAMAVRMARLLAPVMLIGGLTGLFRSLLHANRHFLAPAFLPVVQNSCIIVCILALAHVYGVVSLAVAILLAAVAQVLMLLPALKRHAFIPRPRMDFSDPGLRRMALLMGPVLLTFALGNIVPFVELRLASAISAGAISHLSYAFRLFSLPEQVFVLALSAVLFPFLAKDVSQGDTGAMVQKLSAAVRVSLYLMLPVGMFIMLHSRELVRLFLGWGAFDDAAVAGTAVTLAAYASGLFAVCVRNLLVDACFALMATGLILRVAAGMVVLNVALDYWLAGRLGVAGLSLGFALTAVAHAGLLGVFLRRKLGGLDTPRILAALGRAVAASLAMGAALLALRPALPPLSPDHTLLGRLGLLAVSALAGFAVYAVASKLLASAEQRLLLDALRKRLS